MNATIEDVARKAQVSISTVSRVINRPQLVNEVTRSRVEKAIKQLAFRPNMPKASCAPGATSEAWEANDEGTTETHSSPHQNHPVPFSIFRIHKSATEIFPGTLFSFPKPPLTSRMPWSIAAQLTKGLQNIRTLALE